MPKRAFLMPADPENYTINGKLENEWNFVFTGDEVVRVDPPYKGSLEIYLDLSTVSAGVPMDSNFLIIAENGTGMFTLDYSGDWPEWVTYTPEE